jgi:hypothetical protein
MQDRKNYAKGSTLESTTGYTVEVGEPIVDCKVTASEYGEAALPNDKGYIRNDTQYLVTLEVNGEVKMYRELWKSGNTSTANSVPISDYTYVMDEAVISGLTEDDVVVARFEPVEVITSDAFRAAVGNATPEVPSELPAVGAGDKGKFLHTNESTGALEWSEGGGSGGGVLVVHDVDGTLDKTWQDIVDAEYSVWEHQEGVGFYNYEPLRMTYTGPGDDGTVVYAVGNGQAQFVTTSASGYPTDH